MAGVVREEIVKLYEERIIDNRDVSMTDALTELLPRATTFDLAVGYFYVSGFELVQKAFSQLMENPSASIRVLMGSQTNTATMKVLNAGLTPQEAVLQDIALFEEEHFDILQEVTNWIREGRFKVKVYTGGANYFHAKSYLFQEDEYGLKGSAIVGSSNFSKSGLSGNTELNSMSQDNYRALRKWFDSIWDSSEVDDFLPELIDAVDEVLPKPKERVEYYRPALSTYLEFSRMYAKPPLEIGTTGFWEKLYPHQRVGVAECTNRLQQYGTALLCDGVGLGKTRTAAGVIRELGMPLTLLVVASKLRQQWQDELKVIGIDEAKITYMSKETLARLNAEQLRSLTDYQLIVIDEAHQGFKNSGRKTYRNVQYVLEQAEHPIRGLLLTATPWNNSRTDVFHLGRLFLERQQVPYYKPYKEYLQFAPRRAGKAFELDDKAFSAFWEDLFLQRTRRTYGGEKVTFATRQFPSVEIMYEPKKKTALEDNFVRISSLRLPYMNPLRYVDGKSDDFTSDRMKLLFLKRADSSWTAFRSTLETIYGKIKNLTDDLQYVMQNENEIKNRFRTFIANSYNITQTFDDLIDIDEDADLTEFEMNSKEKRARYVRRMTERIESISKNEAKKAIRIMLQDAKEDIVVLALIRDDLSEAFERKDEKYEVVRDAVIQNVQKGEKVLLISQFRDTTVDYFSRLNDEPELRGYRIGHVSGKADDCYVGKNEQPVSKEDILVRFSPIAKNVVEFVGSEDEIDIVIGTETVSVGQNLQDCKVLMNLDLPYNPMVLEQRIGRIDRPRQTNDAHDIHIYTFPSNPVIEAELKMTERLRHKLEGILQDTRFDDLVMPEYAEYLRQVLTERGEAVKRMVDATVDRTIVPVDAKTHEADYVMAQRRMWRFIQRHPKSESKDFINADSSFRLNEDGKTVAVARTVLRDVNGQEIDTVRHPIVIDEMEANLMKVEAIWYAAIAGSATSTREISSTKTSTALRHAKEKLARWTKIQVEDYNRVTGAKNEVREKLQSTKSKEVAAEIIQAVKGPNRNYIGERIKATGYSTKILRALSSAIEYIDTRDPEYLDVEDLHEDLSRLWNDFEYYAEKFIEDGNGDEKSIEEVVAKRSGRHASLEKSETIWELGHVGL